MVSLEVAEETGVPAEKTNLRQGNWIKTLEREILTALCLQTYKTIKERHLDS